LRALLQSRCSATRLQQGCFSPTRKTAEGQGVERVGCGPQPWQLLSPEKEPVPRWWEGQGGDPGTEMPPTQESPSLTPDSSSGTSSERFSGPPAAPSPARWAGQQGGWTAETQRWVLSSHDNVNVRWHEAKQEPPLPQVPLWSQGHNLDHPRDDLGTAVVPSAAPLQSPCSLGPG
jgi:hypothetical protein